MRWISGTALTAATLALVAVSPGAQASAASSGRQASCDAHAVCLWSGADRTGTKIQITATTGVQCRPLAALGLPQALSVVDNTEFTAVNLYSDTACATATTPSFVQPGGNTVDSTLPAVQSIRFLQLPG